MKSALTTLSCLLSVALLASAQNQTPQDVAGPLLPRETLTGEWFGQGAAMSDRGVEVFANYTRSEEHTSELQSPMWCS